MAPGLLGLLLLLHRPSSESDFGDLRLYYEYSRLSFGHVGNPSIIKWVHDRSAILDPNQSQTFQHIQVPYRDFNCEYPPLALAAFMATDLVASSYTRYVMAFRMEMSLCVTLLCVVLYTILRRCGKSMPDSALTAGAMFSIMVYLLGSMLTERFDVFPSLLVGLSLLFCIRKQYVFAGALVGLGIAAKVWPVALVPIILIGPFKRRDYSVIVTAVAAIVSTVVLAHLPWLIVSPAHAFGYLHFLGSRGLQIESLPANVVMLLAKSLHSPAASVYAWGAQELAAPSLDRWAAGVSTLLAAIVYGLILLLAYSSSKADADRPQHLILAYIAVVLAILLTAKVFSPQYLVWLCPAILAVDLKRRWQLFALFVAVCLCTKLELTFYDALNDLKLTAILMLTVRNAAICLMGVLTVRKMTELAGSEDGAERI